jgi:cytidylate kinase
VPPVNKIIAIDGPSGAGKGTVAKLLAEKLGFKYLDTGALYRACALKLRHADLNETASDEDIEKTLAGTAITFEPDEAKPTVAKPNDAKPGDANSDKANVSDANLGGIYLDGRDITSAIRTTDAGHWSSVFSARAPVRRFLLELQRSAAGGVNLVAEGRDMGTVVFPAAWKKIFLTADTDVRAARRHLQLGGSVTMEEARRDVVERDARDATRNIAPLRAAADAVVVDSSHISIDETVEKILSIISPADGV